MSYIPGTLGARFERCRFLIERTAAVEKLVVLFASFRRINPPEVAEVRVLVLRLVLDPLLRLAVLVFSAINHAQSVLLRVIRAGLRNVQTFSAELGPHMLGSPTRVQKIMTSKLPINKNKGRVSE